MEKVILKAEERDEIGKGGSKRLRRKGLIPGVVYREGKIGISVQIDEKALWRALHTGAGENAIITMNISGKGEEFAKTVIVQEIQTDPINDKTLHVDFHEISLKEKLHVKVPVSVKGEAPGVKEEGGILTQGIWEIEVVCLPTDIPDHISVTVDTLRIGDAVHVKELKFPENVVTNEDPEMVVVSVTPPQAEEVPAEVLPAEEGVEPEIIKKGKKEEEGEEAEGAVEEKKEG